MGNSLCCEQTADIDKFITYCQSYANPDYKDWLKDAPLSQGIYLKGEWGQSSQKSGKGIILSPSKLYYEGDIVNGIPSGKGKAVWCNHTVFIGEIEQSVANGQGQLTFTDDDVSLKGSWINGKVEINKKMVLTYKGKKALVTFLVKQDKSKSKYTQQRELENQDTIYVQLQFQDTHTKYRGDVKLKSKGYQIDGDGEISFYDGSIYRGSFVDGKIQGYGSYSWPNGHWYQGYYENNLRHGQGRYYYSSNKWVEGTWKAGVLEPKFPIQDFKQSNQRDGGKTNQKQKASNFRHTEDVEQLHD